MGRIMKGKSDENCGEEQEVLECNGAPVKEVTFVAFEAFQRSYSRFSVCGNAFQSEVSYDIPGSGAGWMGLCWRNLINT